MEIQAINKNYIRLLSQFGIDLEINNVDDPELPKQEILETSDRLTLRLNNAKLLSDLNYESYVADSARKILLPRLVLETERLILRRFRKEDAEDCFAFLSDPQSCYFDGFQAFTSMDEEYAWLMNKYESQETRYVITLKESGKVIGMLNLLNDDSRAVEAMELGYNISPAYRRMGYGFEAVSAIIKLLQKDLKLDLLLAGILKENTPSENMLRKLGFQREGTRHNAMWHDVLGPIDLEYYYLDKP